MDISEKVKEFIDKVSGRDMLVDVLEIVESTFTEIRNETIDDVKLFINDWGEYYHREKVCKGIIEELKSLKIEE